jgi:undecaprenyl-diphosphatase
MDISHGILFGTVQGISEWLPISSEGVITLIKVNFFHETNLQSIIRFALFLHLGTFLAALIYFWKDVQQFFHALISPRNTRAETKKVLLFLSISTIISGGLGFIILKSLEFLPETFKTSGRAITFIIGLLLLITASIQLWRKSEIRKRESELTLHDSIILGISQALAVLPGISRSGITTSALLIRKFQNDVALKLSFLMSLPIVLLGNIILNSEQFYISTSHVIALFFSFMFGLLTIKTLLLVARKINFGYFVLAVGSLMLIATVF